MRVGILILALLAGISPAAGVDSGLCETGTTIAELKAIAGQGTEDAEARKSAIRCLKTLATGEPSLARTREAIFALAEVLDPGEAVPTNAAMDAMVAAAALYPDDPRTPGVLRRLAPAQVATGNEFSAHISFTRLLQGGVQHLEPDLVVQAADNAVAVGDMAAAYSWIEGIDHASLPELTRARFLLVRLEAAQSLGRTDEAIAACDQLDATIPEKLRVDPKALLAAARAEESVGRLDSAARRYEAFANIHSKSAERPSALLSLGRVLGKLDRAKAARQMYEFLLSEHPDSPEAGLARIDMLELDSGEGAVDRIAAYVDAARAAPDGEGALAACRSLLDRFSEPEGALMALSAVANLVEDEDRVLALAARQALQQDSGKPMSSLAREEENVRLVAAAARIEPLGLLVPEEVRAAVRAERIRLGIYPPPLPPVLADALELARASAHRGAWNEALATIESALATLAPRLQEDPRVCRLLAEALWREGHGTEALSLLRETLKSDLEDSDVRPLRVLRADILFAAGNTEEACADYRSASQLAESPWVESQLERCAAATAPAKESRS